MSVTSTNNKHVYSGNGSTTYWSYTFPIISSTDIEVTITDALGVETVISSGYTVDTAGSRVLYPNSGSPLATGSKITLRRVLPITQGMDLKNRGDLNAENLERGYDRLTMIGQQIQESLDRSIKFPTSSTSSGVTIPEPLADKTLAWSSDGTKLVNGPSAGDIAGAATNASSAAASAAAAATSETNAGLSATAAAASATSASGFSSSASSSSSSASASASTASTQAGNASTSATNAANSATAAATSATNASTYATNSANSATASANSATAAAGSATTAASYTPTQTGNSGKFITTDGTSTSWAYPILTNATGTLPLNHGGTGQTTQAAAFDALSPNTTKGDLTVRGSSSNVRLPIGSDGQVPVADSSATNGLAWKTLQQGAKNYITYNSFENNATTGWSLCTVGAVDATTKAVSGSLTLSAASLSALATTATNPLSGTYSLQTAAATAWASAQGFCSQAYTIDREDLAKPMSFKAYYEVPTGSSLINASGTTSNTFAVWLYDVTNSAWVQPSGSYSMTQLTGVGVVQGSFQLPSTCTSFRLVIVCVNTPTAGALTINWDDFSVGPVTTTVGSPVTDWVAYSPASSQGFGGVSSSGLYWRRVGGNVEIRGLITVGTATAVEAQIALPPGLTTTTDNNNTICGTYARATSSANHGGFVIKQNGVTYMLFGPNTCFSNTASIARNPDTGTNVATGEAITLDCSIPILGWSSSVTMSSDSDTRVVDFRAVRSSQSCTATDNVIAFASGDITKDSHGAFNTGTSKYAIPVAGDYLIGAMADISTTTGISRVKYRVNGGSWVILGSVYFASAPAGSVFVGNSDLATGLKAGDTIEWDCAPGATVTPTYTATLMRLSGPAVVAASETVSLRYYGSSTTVSGSDATVVWTTKDWDSHGIMSAGTITIPSPGKYDIASQVQVTATYALNNSTQLGIFKNGVQVTGAVHYAGGANTSLAPLVVDSVNCVAGDLITIKVNSSGSSPALAATNVRNYVRLTKVAN